MKDEANTKSWSSGQELLEKARNSTSSLMEEHEIAGTPFKAVKDGGGWFAALGMNKLTEEFETTEQLLEWMDNNLWTLMVTVITMVIQTIDLHKIKMAKEAHEARLENAQKRGKEAGKVPELENETNVRKETLTKIHKEPSSEILQEMDEQRINEFMNTKTTQQ